MPNAPAAPLELSDEFKVNPADSSTPAARAARAKYQRGGGKSKLVWVGVCLALTGALVAGGIFGGKFLSEKFGTKEPEPEQPKVENTPTPNTPTSEKKGAMPRRLLFISITRYMYLNPLTAGQPGAPEKSREFANGIAWHWRIPKEKDNGQVFILSDTARETADILPMKNVVQGTYQKFFESTRAQDRIVIYFGGHAVEKEGKAYIVPMEGELEGEGWVETLIPLEHFYGELAKVKATQKVVIWDVCRYNPEKGRNRPGSEPMTEALFKALTNPPAGIQVITSCSTNENALEFNRLAPVGEGPYNGSLFLESMKSVGEKNKVPLTKSPVPEDPIHITEWHPAIAKRAEEMVKSARGDDMAKQPPEGSSWKQTVALAGSPAAGSTPPDPNEKFAAKFDFPAAPKGASVEEIRALADEFSLPPIKPDLEETSLSEFVFTADVMKEYAADVPLAEILKKENKEKYEFRVTVIEALEKIREKWKTGTGRSKIRNTVQGPIDAAFKSQVQNEQDDWAVGITELERELFKLEMLADQRDAQPKRWQANYDFALASIKLRLAYMNEYNKLLGNLRTETVPSLDSKLGQDGYVLVASETLKSGKSVKEMAEEAQELFGKIITTYKGTPWAIQAKRDRSVVIGLAWKPASLNAPKTP